MSKKINISNYFNCISAFDYNYCKYTSEELSFGKNITINTGKKKEYKLANYDIIIFSVGLLTTSTQIRKELFSLAEIDKKIKIIDLGDLKSDKNNNKYSLREALIEIKQEAKNIIIIGNDYDLLQSIYNAYNYEDKLTNISEISPIINFINPNNVDNHKVFHYTNLGYQAHYNHITTIDLINSLGFEAHRFGVLKNNIIHNEYLLRDANIISLNMLSINYFDASDVFNQTPNGFSAQEICQIAYYAGINDNSEIFSVLGILENINNETNTTKLTAQIIWYYISGFSNRYNDNPLSKEKKYKKILVAIEKNNTNITFYSNTANNRWWFEIENNKNKIAISCSEEDYNETLNGNIPLRWIKFDNKVSVY